MIDADVSSRVLQALSQHQTDEGTAAITGFALRRGWADAVVVEISVRSTADARSTPRAWMSELKDLVTRALHPDRSIVEVTEQG